MAAEIRQRRPQRSVVAVGVSFMVTMAAIVLIGIAALGSVQRDFEAFAEEDFPAFNHLIHVDRDLFRAQDALTSAFATDDKDSRVQAVATYRSLVARTGDRWALYLSVAHNSDAEVVLQQSYTSARSAWLATTETLAGYLSGGRTAADPDTVAVLSESRLLFMPARNAVHSLEEDVYEPLVENGIDGPALDPRVLLVMLLGGGVVVSGAAWALAMKDSARQSVELRERDRIEAERIAAVNSRFRSLVESAQDVITVVSGRDDLAVMSPNRQLLAPTDESADSTVCEILPPDAYSLWSQADASVSSGGTSATVELEIAQADGSVVHVEAAGSPLANSEQERVWVWRDISERKELELKLQHQAFHDSLTGVANRALLLDRAAHAISRSARNDCAVSVVFCDLDDFKLVNDSLGHDVGDKLLGVVSRRLQGCIRETDTLARFGGDEFVLLLEDSDAERAYAVAERILRVVPYPVELEDRTICPSLSIGIAGAVPGGTPDELIRNADIAMYEAKANGKGHIEVYQGGMHDVASETLGLQSDLRGALDKGELSLSYQPTISLANGALEGVEALLRWHHPDRGNVPPDTFIPLAEATGLIIPIGKWVLHEALRTAVELQSAQQTPILMHVNLSPLQLRDPQIVQVAKAALEQSGIDPSLVVLEVTEGMLLDDNLAVQRLHELRSLGVLIALDDFGTGYTSVNYLRQLPIDIVKIDRSFISGDTLAPLERKAFLHAIIGLISSLNLHSVAEGIENAAQRDELRDLGCDTGQGFLWSRAVGKHQFQNDLAKLTARPAEVTGRGPKTGSR